MHQRFPKLRILCLLFLFLTCSTIFATAITAKACIPPETNSDTSVNPWEFNEEELPQALSEMIQNYPETAVIKDYYKQYCRTKKDVPEPISIAEALTTDDVPFFLQWDPRWAFLNYGETTMIATSGCGPTCLSMVVTYFTKDPTLHPKAIADFSYQNGYYIENVGTTWDLIAKGGQTLGLKVKSLDPTSEALKEALDQGKIIIASMGSGHFTKGGHYIVIKGYDSKGNFLVNDPNSVIHTKQSWAPEIILSELKRCWSLGLS